MEGKTANCLAYGCKGKGCDYRLRERFDEFHYQYIQKKIEETNAN
jgi:hypothetical protein